MYLSNGLNRFIPFNKWKNRSLSLRWNRRSLLQMITYSSRFLSGHNSDFLVLKQWKSAWNQTMPSLLCLPWNQWLRAAFLFIYFKKAQELRHYPFHHLQISYYTPCLPPQILHNFCFWFLLGNTVVPRKIEDNAFAKFWRAISYFTLCYLCVISAFLSKTCNYLHPFLALFCTHTQF